MRPPWALPNGLPPAHLIRAALRAGSLIDAYGSSVPAAQSAYLLYPSDALYPPDDLRIGEQLLLDCGLLLEKDGLLYPALEFQELVSIDEDEAIAVVFERAVLAANSEEVILDAERRHTAEIIYLAEELIEDPDRREAILIALGQRFDSNRQIILGARGEEYVVACAREQLIELGRDDLAMGVQRLSVITDTLGYDIIAPRLTGKRRLEVKTSVTSGDGLFRLFISRNEVDWGINDPDWALVACGVSCDNEITIIGWCRARTLEPYLPVDNEGGRWESAELEVPVTLFEIGLPPPV